MEDNDDDFFSDEFDSLPPGTWVELEQSAYQATQGQASQYHHGHGRPAPRDSIPQPLAQPSIHTSGTLKPPPRLHTGYTNEYDTLEVGELEAEVHDNVALHQSHNLLATNHGWAAGSAIDDAMDVDEQGEGGVHQWHAHLEKLEREKEQIRRELAEARIQVETKAGEIAIIRSKQNKVAEDHERQMEALRQTIADQVTEHKQAVEAAISEGKMLATENIFLQNELVDESHRFRNYKSRQRDEEKNPPVTPSKNRVLAFRDGFDDDEMAAVSPSKSASRSKRSTPTGAGKRKRQSSLDSPIGRPLSPSGELIMVDAPADDPDPSFEEDDIHLTRASVRNQRAMKLLLNHCMVPGQETDIEALSKVCFPSELTRPISRIILDELAKLDKGSYILEYIYTIGPLLHRTITEHFYEPVPRFLSIIRCVLSMSDAPLPDLIQPLVITLQDSVEVNAVPRFKFSPTAREKARVLRQTPQSDLNLEVDSTEGLRLLYQMASELLHIKSALDDFWRKVRHTFILVMLHGSQRLKDVVLVIHLLSTSVRPDSFGPIMPSEGAQVDVQRWIIDRLSHMLSEPVLPDEGMEPYAPHDICAMRLEALLLLESLAFNPAAPAREHGSIIIATHPNALARLFRSIHDELDALYSSPPEQDVRFALVNGLMRLIFGVMRRHGSSINMQDKLSRVPGAKQKHLVVLTRLAFCDGSVLEAGIDDETVDMAHELLEDWTNPQEAESLAEVFPSSRRE
ncbi:hypothetical protein N7456_009214 [Penicillium angulare]|uniref:DNA repair protein Rad26 n=1 Tax=Penicillium angulare TaxID=116970 RepID=A0A9W9F466_9EURO|nr:hypothetical protein N7456_009214 [Penicillium angulare]